MVEVTLSIYTLRKAKTISFQFVLHFPYFKKEKILSQTLNMGVKKKIYFSMLFVFSLHVGSDSQKMKQKNLCTDSAFLQVIKLL